MTPISVEISGASLMARGQTKSWQRNLLKWNFALEK
jgi:hypothetical protein